MVDGVRRFAAQRHVGAPQRYRGRRAGGQTVHPRRGYQLRQSPRILPRRAAEEGRALYDRFCELSRALGLTVETWKFGAEMAVFLVNDGPVTIWLDTAER